MFCTRCISRLFAIKYIVKVHKLMMSQHPLKNDIDAQLVLLINDVD